MIQIDSHEPELFDFYLSQTMEVDRGNFNQSPGQEDGIYPDFTIISNKLVGVNRKQASEWLGGLDEWEVQLLKELRGPCDYLISVIEGSISNTPSEGLWGWNWQDPSIHYYRNGHGGTAQVTGFPSNYPAKMIWGKKIRMWDLGIPVVETSNIYDTACFLAELHSIVEKEDWESKTFKRLIKEKYIISETEQQRRSFALFLMGIPKVGEEVALAIVDTFENFAEFYKVMCSTGIASLPLSSGRKVGPALNSNIQLFLGIKRGLPTS